ncbi:MAG: phosphate signaling complex protein PhoU [Actinomycetota bacterium]
MRTFHEELRELQSKVLRLGSMAEEAVGRTIKALRERDVKLADEVIADDDVIDELNVKIEEDCITLIARQCPVAKDLRFIATVLRIILHLERIGDLALNIARIAKQTSGAVRVGRILDIVSDMHMQARKMIRTSLKAFAERNLNLALSLPDLDEAVDSLNRQLLHELANCRNKEDFDWVLNMVLVSRYLERIADRAVDIGEQVRYLITGELIE